MEHSIESFWRSPFLQAIAFSAAQSFGWLYINSLTQFLLFKGETRNGDDFGLGTIISGWIIAICWAWFISIYLSQRFRGCRSIAAFILGGVFSLPLSFIVGVWVSGLHNQYLINLRIEDNLTGIFHFLGLGILPEGRSGWAPYHAIAFIFMGFLSLYGFLKHFRARKKTIDSYCCFR